MAVYTAINDPSVYFQTALYTGNASTLNVVNGGNANLQPDWVWLKNYGTSGKDYGIFDSTRGTTKMLSSNNNSAESTNATSLTSFNTDGFTLGADGGPNANGSSNVAWQWKANGGTTASNSSGSVTSTVQANTTAGFSIVTYTATGSGDITVGHGLGAAPEVILTKTRSVSYDWRVFISSDMGGGAGKSLQLDGTGSLATNNSYPSPAPTSTVMTMGRGGDDNNNYANGQTLVSYCFRSIQGYSKFGNYYGNGNADGPFVYTGFKPAWLMYRNIDRSENWIIVDNKRNTINPVEGANLQANENDAQANETRWEEDFLSNGFKIRTNGSNNQASNSAGERIFYMTFASNPFVTSDGVPTTAR
tara:strand:- start:2 stop:1084 length:1083 start_codon:yes stop_codon:yes gene_type:complete